MKIKKHITNLLIDLKIFEKFSKSQFIWTRILLYYNIDNKTKSKLNEGKNYEKRNCCQNDRNVEKHA